MMKKDAPGSSIEKVMIFPEHVPYPTLYQLIQRHFKAVPWTPVWTTPRGMTGMWRMVLEQRL